MSATTAAICNFATHANHCPRCCQPEAGDLCSRGRAYTEEIFNCIWRRAEHIYQTRQVRVASWQQTEVFLPGIPGIEAAQTVLNMMNRRLQQLGAPHGTSMDQHFHVPRRVVYPDPRTGSHDLLASTAAPTAYYGQQKTVPIIASSRGPATNAWRPSRHGETLYFR